MIAVAFARSPLKLKNHPYIRTIYDDQYDLENVNPHLYDDEFLGNTDLDDLIEIMIEEIDSLIKKFTGRRK
jgi:predicted CoA-binding protein